MDLKLTLVRVCIGNQSASFFTMAPMVNGHAVVSMDTIQRKLAELWGGPVQRGVTFSCG